MKKVISVIMFIIMAVCFCSCEKEMTPIYADEINDGTYSVDVKSSSSMFKIIECKLTVRDGKMTAVMTLSGTGYEKLCMNGTRETADSFDESDYSYFVEDESGKYSYTVSVDALDKEIPCAAFSIRKQKWYDRDLVFMSETLPNGALKFNPIPVIIIISAAVLALSVVIVIIKCIRRKEK